MRPVATQRRFQDGPSRGFAGQAAIFVTAPVLATELTGSLEVTGLILGAFATGGVLTALSPDGTATVEIEGRHVGIGAFASERILVTA